MTKPNSQKAYPAPLLRSWREKMGLTPQDAAKRLGVSLRTFQRWENDGADLVVQLACKALFHRLDDHS